MNDLNPTSKQPIPKDARLVFKGLYSEIYQWDQVMYDGSVAIFEKIKRVDSALVIPVTQNNNLIIARQEQPGIAPFMGVLGGRVDAGETPIECAVRELAEETGLRAKSYELWYASQPSSIIEWVENVYIAKDIEKYTNPRLDSGEKIQLLEVTFDEFLKIAIRPDFRDLQIKLKSYDALLDPQKKQEMKKLFFK